MRSILINGVNAFTIPILTDVAKFNPNVRTELIDEAAKAFPEFEVLPWKPVPGTSYQTLVRTANPVVGFRAQNTGTPGTKSTYVNRDIACKILNPRIECDKAVADACIDGRDVFLANEEVAHMAASFEAACKQLWYGTDADALGFPGLANQVDSGMVVDAGGSSAVTSVYVVCGGRPDWITWVLGGDGSFELSDVRVESITDDDGNRFTAYVQDGVFWVGSQLGHSKAVARIRDLDASGHTLTDDLITQAFEKFPASMRPTGVFMNNRSRFQLQRSRTATSPTGAPAPIPTEVHGVPIHVTEALTNAETAYPA